MSSHFVTWIIAALATAGVIVRPFGWPEFVWAVAGAALLTGSGLLAPGDALSGVAKGVDVYLFLVGMMLMAEIAREEGLFDWLAARATTLAKGSAQRLFALVYLVGTFVTIFLSNDATAVVLTPAVAAAVKTAGADKPLPYLLICAFVANAASFVLPISNPANLVIYGSHLPPLLQWIPRYGPPSFLAIVATYVVLRWTQREALRQTVRANVDSPPLSTTGKVAAAGLGATAVVLLAASAFGIELGLPTAICGLITAGVVLTIGRRAPWSTIAHVSWSVLPLVAGLFVLVEALDRSGLTGAIGTLLRETARQAPVAAGWSAGLTIAVASNLMNNLPAGLIAAGAVQSAHPPDGIVRAILIGVDLGPNLSVTGSLATILWLTALRREGLHCGAWAFLKLGCLVTPPALVVALAASYLFG